MSQQKKPGGTDAARTSSRSAAAVGHKIFVPDGRSIVVDAAALRELRRAHLLDASRTRILPGIRFAIEAGLLSARTVNHLGGVALTGPETCVCRCWDCLDGRGGVE